MEMRKVKNFKRKSFSFGIVCFLYLNDRKKIIDWFELKAIYMNKKECLSV